MGEGRSRLWGPRAAGGTQQCGAALASQREGSIPGSEDWGGRGAECAVEARGPQGNLAGGKDGETSGGRRREREVREEKAPRGEGLQRGGGGRRAVTGRKRKSDGGTSGGRRQGPGEELEKSQGEGWEVTGM